MQYVYQQRTADSIGSLAGTVAQGATVLGFNEPDQASQAAMSPAQAAALYKQYLTPLRKSGKIAALSSPGTTNGGSGLPWLQEFMGMCTDCNIDFLQVHWYGPNIDMFKSQLGAVHAAFPNLQLWITEIGCTNWNPATNPSPSDVSKFMSEATSFLDSTPYVSKYAFFGAMPINDPALGSANQLMSGGSLTALGQKYVS